MSRSFLCVIEGRGSQWEAMCLDLDIAVAGETFDDTMRSLEDAVALYVETALEEAPSDAARLLARRAPLWLRVKTVAQVFFGLLLAPRGSKAEIGGGFRLPCPA